MFKKYFSIAMLVGAFALPGCTRVETGHVGVRTAFNGQVEMTELGVGFHQTVVGHITQLVANEITLEIKDLHPQTKDRTNLSDLDLTFTYSVEPGSIAELITKYKGRDLSTEHGIYPAGAYVVNVVQTATADVIGKYPALEANENREKIRSEIRVRVDELLTEEKLKGKVIVHQVFVKNLTIDPSLQASALRAINAQNDLKAKTTEVETAKKEAERMAALSQQGDGRYVGLLNAQANMVLAQAAANGKVNTIVVPFDFKGIVNVK
jgi:regulator of protease activity HflC (stomatin/prohibitin superfamily)